ncbi:hypothetical protein D3C73_815860 [compost metagenome]
MLEDAVTQRMAVLVVELLEVVDIEHDQRHAALTIAQRLLQQPGERAAVEQFGQAIEGGGQLCAFKLAAQAADFALCRVQLGQEALLLGLHQLGAVLQFAEDIWQAFIDRRLEHFDATPQAALEIQAALDAARHVAMHVVHQVDRLLLAGARLFQLITDDVVAKQPRGRLRRKAVEVPDHAIQVTIEFGVLALAVGVPQRVMHRIGRDVVFYHQGNSLFEQSRGLAGVFRIQRQRSRTRLYLAHVITLLLMIGKRKTCRA